MLIYCEVWEEADLAKSYLQKMNIANFESYHDVPCGNFFVLIFKKKHKQTKERGEPENPWGVF